METLGFEVVSLSKNYAELKVEFDEKLQNNYGIFHGGVYFALADQTAGYASKSEGISHVTANASIHYMVPVQSGALTAKATVINRSGKLCVVDVEIFNDRQQLVNKGTFTMYALTNPEL